jgi:hypothetical protein
MFIKPMTLASAAVLGLLSFGYTAFANPAIPGQAADAGEAVSMTTGAVLKVADGWDSPRSHRRHRFARHRDWHDGYHWYSRHRESGLPYSSCYMKCIYSSHPADFCGNVARDHFCY